VTRLVAVLAAAYLAVGGFAYAVARPIKRPSIISQTGASCDADLGCQVRLKIRNPNKFVVEVSLTCTDEILELDPYQVTEHWVGVRELPCRVKQFQ
jgi:hypothetical protein